VFVARVGSRGEEVVQRIVAMAVRECARMAEWLALIAEMDRLETARQLGYSGTSQWLAAECRMTPRTARDYVRVAHRLEEWKLVQAALVQGQVSYSQCRALSRASRDEDEAALLHLAKTSSTSQLEQHVRALRTAASAGIDVVNRARERRSVNWAWDEDGSLKLWGRLGPVEGAAFVEAIDTGAELVHACEARVRPPLGARRADALAEIAQSGCPRTTLMLHADVDALACWAAGDRPRGGKILALRNGPAIPSELARRLTCDAMVSVTGLNMGRTQRVISPPQRRALEERDGRVCWMPGCDRTHGLDGHHIRHWTQGGRTDLDNLVLLCAYHHRLFHEGGFTMTRRREAVVVRDAQRRVLYELPRSTAAVATSALRRASGGRRDSPDPACSRAV
jgi:hypothetical protein